MTKVRMEALRYSTPISSKSQRSFELHLRFHTYRLGWTDSRFVAMPRDAGRSARTPERAHTRRLRDTERQQGKGARTSYRRDGGTSRGYCEHEELEAIRPEIDGTK